MTDISSVDFDFTITGLDLDQYTKMVVKTDFCVPDNENRCVSVCIYDETCDQTYGAEVYLACVDMTKATAGLLAKVLAYLSGGDQ